MDLEDVKEGAAADLALPHRFSRRLFYASFLPLLPAIVALYEGEVLSAGLLVFVASCSVTYWHNPVRGIRRSADIAAVCLCGTYQFSLALESRFQREYIVLLVASVLCYANALRLRDDPDTSSWLYVHAHVFGSASNLLIYAGLRPTPLIKCRPTVD